MDTMLIQITNQKATRLLHELEGLHLIKVLKKNVSNGQKLSDKYEGKLSAATAEALQDYVTKSRLEWEERNIS